MLALETLARIRRLYFAEHWKVGTIAAELGVHHEAVEAAIESESFGRHRRIDPRPSILDPYKPFVLDTLEQHPRLRATRLFEMLRTRGYAGAVFTVRRYVRLVRPVATREAYFRLDTLPGEQGQVDWGSFGKLRIGHALRALSCFVMVLGWSRAFFARFTLDQTLESFLRAHVLAFERLGVARTLLYDNLKSVVLERVGQHVRFHPRLLDLAGHYHFAPQPCAPYRGNEKGKVERVIQYLRHGFFAARRFSSVEDLNRQLDTWISEVAEAREVPGDPERRSVRDALAHERTLLLPLPEHRFECDLVRPAQSGKRPYVRFDQNDYSIPFALVHKPLTLVASETGVRVLDGATEVARHERSYDRARIVEDAAHLADLGAHKRQARELRGRDRLRSVCPSTDALLGELARRGESVASHTTRLLGLLDRYGASALDSAIAEAVSRGAFGAQSVAHICDQHRRARHMPPVVAPLPDDSRARDMRITAHRLSDYDDLAPKKTPPDSEDAT